ncbi:2OG-Fe(II) oxygenase [Flavobacterium oreochromis]|uniref:prolyl hydroxylase family protein n=1 Tax=Flavobacterium oreochromis TaxID=2906078 RepID=UPI00385FBF5C
METIYYNPQIFVIKNFLTPTECQSLIDTSEVIGYEEAKVQTGANTQTMLKGVRNNDRILFENQVMADELYQRALPHLTCKIGYYKMKGFNEMFRFYRYEPGQRFKMHRDGSFVRNENEQSFFTFLVYLNDDFEGGETEFEDIATVQPKAGDALVFYHPYRHEGKTLLSGKKYVLRTDIMFEKEILND